MREIEDSAQLMREYVYKNQDDTTCQQVNLGNQLWSANG